MSYIYLLALLTICSQKVSVAPSFIEGDLRVFITRHNSSALNADATKACCRKAPLRQAQGERFQPIMVSPSTRRSS